MREDTPDRAALPASYLRDLKSIRASAQHLARLIGDVLDLASSQAGELRLMSEPLDLGETLQEAVWLGELMAREKGLTWRADVPEQFAAGVGRSDAAEAGGVEPHQQRH